MESHASIKGPPSQRQAFRSGLFERTAAPPFFQILIAMYNYSLQFVTQDAEVHRFIVEGHMAAFRLMNTIERDYGLSIMSYLLIPLR